MSLIIGVDVAKFFSTYTFLDSNGTLIYEPFNANNDLNGLTSILTKAEKVAIDPHDKPIIIMESTGYFSNRLRDFFNTRNFKVLEINPLISNSIRSASIRKVKNDKVDSYDLANLFLTSKFNKTIDNKLRIFKEEDYLYTNLRVLTRARFKLVKAKTSLKIRLLADLEQVLPYYANVFHDFCCKSSLLLLERICDTQTIEYDEFCKLLKSITPYRGNTYFESHYEKLTNCLNDSNQIGRNVPSYFITIKINVTLIRQYDSQVKHISKEIADISTDLDNVRLLTTIPGISETLAPILASEIGDIKKFSNAKSLVAFCGIDPAVKQSGQYNKLHNRISKRGAPRLRSALYMAALLSVTKYKNGKYANKVLYDYYHMKRESKPGNVALGAVMHKLVRIIYSVLKNQKEFVMITPEQQCKMYESNIKLIA